MPEQHVLLCRYHYDPVDRLAGLAQTSDADARFFYRKNRLATQIQGALGISLLQTDDQTLAQQQGGQVTLLASDGQQSVVRTFQGGQQQELSYTAYGHQPAGSGLASLLGFNGERRDPVTGHYLLGNGYRAFNPVLMRFNSPDSLSPFGAGGINAYAYCQGDPLNLADPSGRLPAFLVGFKAKQVAAVASLGIAVASAVAAAVVEDGRLKMALGAISVITGVIGSVGVFSTLNRQRSGSVGSAANGHTLAEYRSPSLSPAPAYETPPPAYEFPPSYEEVTARVQAVRQGSGIIETPL